MRWVAGLAAAAAAAGLAVGATGAAAATSISYTYNLDDYSDDIFELALPSTLPAGQYSISMTSTVPISLFEFGNAIKFEVNYFYPDGVYMSGDEGVETGPDFSVDPAAEGHPLTDQEMGSVPATWTVDQYYDPGGPLYSSTVNTVLYSFISLASFDPGGVATVTLTPVPEPAAWTMMLLGLGGLGAMMRRRSRSAPC